MTLDDFTSSIATLAERGFTVERALYWSEAFGSWSMQFSSKTISPHLLLWDGKERWLILQGKRPENERTVRVTPKELRQMSYEEGAITVARREADEWRDKWIGRDAAEQSLDRALREFGRS